MCIIASQSQRNKDTFLTVLFSDNYSPKDPCWPDAIPNAALVPLC